MPLSRCCFCLRVEVGAQLIAIFSFVSSSLISVVYGAAAQLHQMPSTRYIAYHTLATISALHGLLGCLLIYGAFQRKPGYMWPWILLSWTMSVLLTLVAMTAVISITLTPIGDLPQDVFYMTGAFFVYGLVLLYSALVVNTRRADIVKEEATKHHLQNIGGWKYI